MEHSIISTTAGSKELLVFSNSLGFTCHWCGKFTSPDPHWVHLTRTLEDYELMLVTDGVLHIAADNTYYTVRAGECLLMSPTVRQYGVKSSYCSFHWMHFDYNSAQNNHKLRSTAEPFSRGESDLGDESDLLFIPRLFIPRMPERLVNLFNQLQDCDRRYHNAILNAYLTGTILAEISLQARSTAPENTNKNHDRLCDNISDYIRWHISDPLRIDELAAYFNYNEKYLTTVFKGRTGIPLKQYIIRAKMEHAKSVLTETDLPVSQIAYQLSFKDVHNFSHAFKAAVGMPPGRYRELYRR